MRSRARHNESVPIDEFKFRCQPFVGPSTHVRMNRAGAGALPVRFFEMCVPFAYSFSYSRFVFRDEGYPEPISMFMLVFGLTTVTLATRTTRHARKDETSTSRA